MHISKLRLGLILLAATIFYDWTTVYTTTDSLQSQATQYVAMKNISTPDKAFSQDGCTMFPNTILWHDLRPACLQHDIAYWAGGTEQMKVEADLDFANTIKATGPLGPVIAPLAYVGVSVFGDSWLTKLVGAHWGYGWD